MLIALITGLVIAGLWGLADIQSSHITMSTTRSTVIAQGSGMVASILCGMLFPMGGIELSIHSLSATLSVLVGLGLLAGVGYFSLYKAFQSSLPVGQVSSMVASNSAVSTLLSWLVFHDVNLASILLLLCGAVLMAGKVSSDAEVPSDRRSASLTPPVLQGIVWSMVAALCLGGFNFGLGFASGVTGAWYILLMGSRAISLLLLAFVLASAGSRSFGKEGDHVVGLRNIGLAVGVGVTEMLGLLLLSFSAEQDQLHLTLVLAVSSCSVLLPFGYSVYRGMRVQPVHLGCLSLILFGLITLKAVQATTLSMVILVLLIAFVIWKYASVGSSAIKWIARPIPFTLESVRVLMATSLETVTMSNISSTSVIQSSASSNDASSTHDQDTRDQERSASSGEVLSSARRPQNQRSLLVPLCSLFIICCVALLPSLLVPNLAYANLALVSVGTVSFTSSGQLDPGNTLGVEDGVAFSLHGLVSPAAGQAYYLWLLSDVQGDDGPAPRLVGTISTVKGDTQVLFTDPSHQNLLGRYSRFLITQQASNPVPLVPQTLNVLYQGSIPNMPTPNDPKRYSLLDHLRHLLATDPTIANNGLSGGLNIWLSRNTQKVLEWTTAARDGWQTQQSDLIHRHMLRILDTLDGVTYASQDVPPGSPFLADPQASHFGLLSMTPSQEPPGLLPHVSWHLQGVIGSPGHAPSQDQIVQTLLPTLDKAANHLETVRADVKKLVLMSNDQLTQPSALTLMNDVVTNAMAAYLGDPDSVTGTNTGGIIWITSQVQRLAVMPINRVS